MWQWAKEMFLASAYLHRLKYLLQDPGGNKFSELQVVEEMACPLMNRLILSFENDRTMIEDIGWMAKLEGFVDSVCTVRHI